MVTHTNMFTGDEGESERYVKRWLKKTYGVDPVKIYDNF